MARDHDHDVVSLYAPSDEGALRAAMCRHDLLIRVDPTAPRLMLIDARGIQRGAVERSLAVRIHRSPRFVTTTLDVPRMTRGRYVHHVSAGVEAIRPRRTSKDISDGANNRNRGRAEDRRRGKRRAQQR